MILLNNVTKVFENNKIGVKNINLSIEKGEFVFITGESGAGKSTLFKLIIKETEPTSGDIYMGDTRVNDIPNKGVPYYRRKFGIVKQDLNLLEDRTIYDNIEFAMRATGKTEAQIKSTIPAALGMVGIRSKANLLPQRLSGGERCRATLARAIANGPDILIADEPTANLDGDMAWDIMQLIDEINRHGITVLIATHAKELVDLMKKRVVTLHDGRLMGDVKKGKYGYLIDPWYLDAYNRKIR